MFFSKTCHGRLVTLLAVAGLTACGGYTTVNLGGKVSGLVADGLVLANGDDMVALHPLATGGEFTYQFPYAIDAHGTYAVTVQSQPPHYTCLVANAAGRASGLPIDYANVICNRTPHILSGRITGLTGSNLTLINGADTLTVAANATTFAFANRVLEQDTYGIAVFRQPDQPGQICTVQNGTGVVGATDPGDIAVSCINQP